MELKDIYNIKSKIRNNCSLAELIVLIKDHYKDDINNIYIDLDNTIYIEFVNDTLINAEWNNYELFNDIIKEWVKNITDTNPCFLYDIIVLNSKSCTLDI